MADKPDGMTNAGREKWLSAAMITYVVIVAFSPVAQGAFMELDQNESRLLPFAAGYAINLTAIAIAFVVFKPRLSGMDPLNFVFVPAIGAAWMNANSLIASDYNDDLLLVTVSVVSMILGGACTLRFLFWTADKRLK